MNWKKIDERTEIATARFKQMHGYAPVQALCVRDDRGWYCSLFVDGKRQMSRRRRKTGKLRWWVQKFCTCMHSSSFTLEQWAGMTDTRAEMSRFVLELRWKWKNDNN